MFRQNKKNQTPENTRRRPVVSTNNSQAFSYRASRSRSEQATGRKEEVKRQFRWRTDWLMYLPTYFAMAVIIGCLVYASTLTGRPRVEVFGITQDSPILREKTIYEQATADLMRKSLLNYSKLTLDTNYIAAQLRTQFPELRTVDIAIPLVNRQPVVRLELAAPVLTIISGGKHYALNEQGIAMIDVTSLQNGNNLAVPTLDDQTNLPVAIGSPAVTGDTVRFIRTVVGELESKKIKVQSLALPKTPEELDVRLEGQSYYLKLNLLNDARQQAGTYLALKQKIEDERTPVKEYIDVRVDERAYFK